MVAYSEADDDPTLGSYEVSVAVHWKRVRPRRPSDDEGRTWRQAMAIGERVVRIRSRFVGEFALRE